MKYPFWLPKTRHWLRTLELGLLSIPVLFLLRLFWYLVITVSLPSILSGEAFSSIWFNIWLVLCVLFPPYVFAHAYEFFHDEELENLPDWIPRPRCIVNGFAYWIIFISAAIIACLAWIDLEAANNDYILESRQEYVERMTPFITVTWVIISAYLFYLKDGIFWLVGEFLKLPGALFGAVLGKKRRKKKPKRDVEEK